MTPEEYLMSLIIAQQISSIPVQTSELEFLLQLMKVSK
jgi:hypothetical protein